MGSLKPPDIVREPASSERRPGARFQVTSVLQIALRMRGGAGGAGGERGAACGQSLQPAFATARRTESSICLQPRAVSARRSGGVLAQPALR